jgi:hypothetical protein
MEDMGNFDRDWREPRFSQRRPKPDPRFPTIAEECGLDPVAESVIAAYEYGLPKWMVARRCWIPTKEVIQIVEDAGIEIRDESLCPTYEPCPTGLIAAYRDSTKNANEVAAAFGAQKNHVLWWLRQAGVTRVYDRDTRLWTPPRQPANP